MRVRIVKARIFQKGSRFGASCFKMPGMRKAAFLLTVLLAGSAFSDGAREPRRLTIFFTGFVRGMFEPCGCKVKPSGGLARKAGYMGEYRKDQAGPTLEVDTGNYFKPLGPNSGEINDLMLKSLHFLPVQVLNLGNNDLFFWDHLARNKPAGTRVISSNLTPRDPDHPRPQRYAIVTIPASRLHLHKDVRIGFIGLADPAQVKPNSGFTAEEPLQAASEAMQALKGKTDFVVVLADLRRPRTKIGPESVIYQLAHRFPQIYAILLAESHFILYPPEQIDNAVVLSSVERGRFLGQLVLQFDASGKVVAVEPDTIELNKKIKEDPSVLSLQSQLAARLH